MALGGGGVEVGALLRRVPITHTPPPLLPHGYRGSGGGVVSVGFIREGWLGPYNWPLHLQPHLVQLILLFLCIKKLELKKKQILFLFVFYLSSHQINSKEVWNYWFYT